MDVNIKNLEAAVVARLAEQAAAEGISQQEWMRRALRRTAGRLSPAELTSQRRSLAAMDDEEFDKLAVRAADRRRAGAERLGASDRRR